MLPFDGVYPELVRRAQGDGFWASIRLTPFHQQYVHKTKKEAARSRLFFSKNLSLIKQ